MTKPLNIILSIVLAFAVASLAGCSISHSSESSSGSSKSSSDLLSSPFASSSESSASDQEKFAGDVADYTAEFVTSRSGTMEGFRNQLSKIAQDHGITHWENNLSTYLAIGRGLKKAQLGDPQVSAFTESLGGDDPMKRQAIIDGLNQ